MLVPDDDDFTLEEETEWGRNATAAEEQSALDAALRSTSRSTQHTDEGDEQASALSLEPFQSLLPLVLQMVEANRSASANTAAARMTAIRRRIAQCEFMVTQCAAGEGARDEQQPEER